MKSFYFIANFFVIVCLFHSVISKFVNKLGEYKGDEILRIYEKDFDVKGTL